MLSLMYIFVAQCDEINSAIFIIESQMENFLFWFCQFVEVMQDYFLESSFDVIRIKRMLFVELHYISKWNS